MPVTPPVPAASVAFPSRARAWATSTLWAGLIWLSLAMAPIPGTTFIGVPVSLYALLGGLISAREGQVAGDRVAVRRARWGLGLGCAGYVYLSAFFLIAGSVLAAGLVAAVRAAWSGSP